jgi:hypoxanthine-DNA glycosylase
MSRVSGFPPVVGSRPRVLILGSMPSVASLEHRQYYAHPRNAYWRIMGDLFDAGPERPYRHRLEALKERGIALWDVLESCVRPGSLDSNICDHTASTNDFGELFVRHPTIRHVFFNGGKAASVFRRDVLPELGDRFDLILGTLPSTSPAHASRTYAQKLRAWSMIRRALDQKT